MNSKKENILETIPESGKQEYRIYEDNRGHKCSKKKENEQKNFI